MRIKEFLRGARKFHCVSPEQAVRLVELEMDGVINRQQARMVLDEMIADNLRNLLNAL